jgi:hypothetical protein
MTSVHGSCSHCGDIEVPVVALSVEAPSATQPGSYVFTCPVCAQPVRERAGARLAEVLVAFGARAAADLDAHTPVVAPTRTRMSADAVARVHLFAA